MQKESPRPFTGLLLAIGLALVMLAVVFWAFRMSPEVEVESPKKPPKQTEVAESKSSYRNRAIWQTSTPPQGAPAKEPQRPAIRGFIYDEQGNPVAGAVVSATTFEVAGNVPSLAGSVKSEETGRFELPLSDGTYQIDALHDDYGPTSATARTGETVSLVLPSSGIILGKVLDENKQPVPRFSIEVISVVPSSMPAPAPVVSRSFSDAEGRFQMRQIPAWPVVIKASAEGFSAAFTQPLSVAAKEQKQVELTLPRGCNLVGRVEDKAGAPVPYVLVNAESRLIAGSSSELTMNAANQIQSDETGRFRLEHVPTGTVLVRAYDGTHAVKTETVEISNCQKVPEVKLVLSSGGGLAGIAKTSGGTPISGARLSLANRTVGFVASRSDAEGRFRFDRLPPGAARLEMHHEGQRTLVNVTIKDGEVLNQDMVLFERGQGEIRGRITANKRPLPNARLLIAAGHGKKGVDTYYTVTGPDGSYKVSSVPEGLYLVSVISTPQGQGIKVPKGGVVTVDLDVTPKEKEVETVDPGDEPMSTQSTAPAGGTAPAQSTTPAPPTSTK